jgi:hypothetical protein
MPPEIDLSKLTVVEKDELILSLLPLVFHTHFRCSPKGGKTAGSWGTYGLSRRHAVLSHHAVLDRTRPLLQMGGTACRGGDLRRMPATPVQIAQDETSLAGRPLCIIDRSLGGRRWRIVTCAIAVR